MSTEKFFRILAYLKEAKSVASAMTLPPDSRPNTQKLHLIRLLDRTQHLVVSLRADFMDLFYFKSPYEASAPEPFGWTGPAEIPPEDREAERLSKVVPFNRRRAQADRRRRHTYLARDRRSGIADRRRRKQPPGNSVRNSLITP